MPSGANAGSSSGGGSPTGSAGGSLTGTYPNPTIATIPSGATATTQSAADNSTKVATTAYTDTGLALKANLAGPTFTGVVTLPTGSVATTQTADNNSTALATTAYADTIKALKANLASPTFTGTPSLPTGTTATTQSASDNSTKLGTTAYIDTADALKANLASPTFTGTPSLPTGTTGTSQSAADNSTKLATTLYTDRAAALATVSWSNPTGAVAATYPRVGVALTTRTAITAILYMDAIYIPTGTVISNFNAISSATAASCTHAWCALFNNSRVQLAATADDTSSNGGWTADTTKTQPIATTAGGANSTFTTTYSGLHYVGICTVFTGTAPSIRGDAASTAVVNTLPPIICGPSNGSQTTPNAFAFTANALTPSGTHDYIWLT